ncbi:MAG: hypothetical protein P8L37_02985 [Phycisphaerales bacterium]|nr:hypothetical protein [Phycisphaerales bacterium]
MRSIDVVVRTLSNAVKAGLELRRGDPSQDKPLTDDEKKSERRSSRSQFSAASEEATAETEAEAASEAKAEQVAEQS